MAWQTETRTESTNNTSESIWLKFEPLAAPGDYSQITMRVLGGDPSKVDEPACVWVHWHASKPYNCPGFEDCPVCSARQAAMKSDPTGYKRKFQLNYKYFFNVLVDDNGPKVKIFSFGGGLGKKLKSFQREYGDLRDYYIKVRKTKVGHRPEDIEYEPFFLADRGPFTEEQIAIAATQMHDLKPFITPATLEELQAVAQGQAPQAPATPDRPSVNEQSDLLVQLEDIVAARKMTLSDLEVTPDTPAGRIRELISLLAPGS